MGGVVRCLIVALLPAVARGLRPPLAGVVVVHHHLKRRSSSTAFLGGLLRKRQRKQRSATPIEAETTETIETSPPVLVADLKGGQVVAKIPRYFLGDSEALFSRFLTSQNVTDFTITLANLSQGEPLKQDVNAEEVVRARLISLWQAGDLIVNDRERWRLVTTGARRSLGEDQVQNGASRARAVWRGLSDEDDVKAALAFLKTEVHPSVLDASTPVERKLRLLLDHFKTHFPYYRDACEHCGNATDLVGEVACVSNDEKVEGRASRAELRACSSCGKLTRFVRANAVRRVLKEKRGRCGEYAAAFLAVVLALDVPARWMFDATDHIWVEALVDDDWIHCDPCEAALNEPLLYSANWGKNSSLVAAFANDTAIDLTSKYYPNGIDVEKVRARDQLPDSIIHAVLEKYTSTSNNTTHLSSSRFVVGTTSAGAARVTPGVASSSPRAPTPPPEVAKAR